ncbi:MAG: (2Fe-2S)-binding protein [Bacteroidales bacterium]|nr:(2Fe-2S)-binding protein [Bacteroidales bacterium]
MPQDRMVCLCAFVCEEDIRKLKVEVTALTLEQVQFETGAGANCGSCLPIIDEILADVNKSDIFEL